MRCSESKTSVSGLGDLRPSTWRSLVDQVKDRLRLPEVDEKSLAGLKFSEALPRHLAETTLADRLADLKLAFGEYDLGEVAVGVCGLRRERQFYQAGPV
jgi:hypothetical protein